MNGKKRVRTDFLRGHWLSLIITIIIVALFIHGVGTAAVSSKSEEKKLLEDNLYRAAVTCYADTGSYPASLSQLCDDYSVKIDDSRFSVQYSIFASNIMPDITVIDLEEDDSQ